MSIHEYDISNLYDMWPSFVSICRPYCKACGVYALCAEHMLHSSLEMHTVLSICFSHLLSMLWTEAVVVLIVNNITREISIKGNYTHIAVAAIVSKVVDLSEWVKQNSLCVCILCELTLIIVLTYNFPSERCYLLLQISVNVNSCGVFYGCVKSIRQSESLDAFKKALYILLGFLLNGLTPRRVRQMGVCCPRPLCGVSVDGLSASLVTF